MPISTTNPDTMRDIAEMFCDVLDENDETRKKVVAFVGWLFHWGIEFMAVREDAFDRILGTESGENR